jgi:hypothetical protein
VRVTTSGVLRRIDLAPVLDLVPPLLLEWADLRFDARADLHTTTTTWNADGAVSLRARGLGRLVMLVVGGRLRRRIEEWLEQLWRISDQRMADSEAALRELAGMTEREGGAAAFVRRALWDPHFDPRPPSASR